MDADRDAGYQLTVRLSSCFSPSIHVLLLSADIYGLLRFGRFRPWNDWNDFNSYVVCCI